MPDYSSDYVWVPKYTVPGHIRNRRGLLLSLTSPNIRSQIAAADEMVRELRDPANPTFRWKVIGWDSQVEDEDGESIRAPIDLSTVNMTDAFAMQGDLTRFTKNWSIFDHSNGLRAFVAAASPVPNGAYWFWVQAYAEPILDAASDACVILGCRDTLTYYQIPWQVVKPLLSHASVSYKKHDPSEPSHYNFKLEGTTLQFSPEHTLDVTPYQRQMEATGQPPARAPRKAKGEGLVRTSASYTHLDGQPLHLSGDDE